MPEDLSYSPNKEEQPSPPKQWEKATPQKAPLNAKQKKALKDKKRKTMKKIRDVISEGEVTEEDAKKIAAQWINIADIDGDGLIDFQEFKDFMFKIENESDEKSTD